MIAAVTTAVLTATAVNAMRRRCRNSRSSSSVDGFLRSRVPVARPRAVAARCAKPRCQRLTTLLDAGKRPAERRVELREDAIGVLIGAALDLDGAGFGLRDHLLGARLCLTRQLVFVEQLTFR